MPRNKRAFFAGVCKLLIAYLGASDGLESMWEKLIQGVVIDVWRKVSNPNRCIRFPWLKARAVMIELKSHRWIAVWNHLSTKTMHGQYSPLISVKIERDNQLRPRNQLLKNSFMPNSACFGTPPLDVLKNSTRSIWWEDLLSKSIEVVEHAGFASSSFLKVNFLE